MGSFGKGTTALPARLSKIMGRAFMVALPMPTSTGDGFVVRNPRTVWQGEVLYFDRYSQNSCGFKLSTIGIGIVICLIVCSLSPCSLPQVSLSPSFSQDAKEGGSHMEVGAEVPTSCALTHM